MQCVCFVVKEGLTGCVQETTPDEVMLGLPNLRYYQHDFIAEDSKPFQATFKPFKFLSLCHSHFRNGKKTCGLYLVFLVICHYDLGSKGAKTVFY